MSWEVVSEFVTIDGVLADPGDVDGFARGGWAFRYRRGPKGGQYKLDEILSAEVLVPSRSTYQGFAEARPSRTDDSGFAAEVKSIPTYVALETLDGNGTTPPSSGVTWSTQPKPKEWVRTDSDEEGKRK